MPIVHEGPTLSLRYSCALAGVRTSSFGNRLEVELGGTEADFQVAIQENFPPLHDQKKFFLSNAPIYKVYIHRSILTSRSSPRATYRRDRMDKAL